MSFWQISISFFDRAQYTFSAWHGQRLRNPPDRKPKRPQRTARATPVFRTGFFLDKFSKSIGGQLLGLTNRLLQFAARPEKRRPGLAPSAGRPSRNGRTGRYICRVPRPAPDTLAVRRVQLYALHVNAHNTDALICIFDLPWCVLIFLVSACAPARCVKVLIIYVFHNA